MYKDSYICSMDYKEKETIWLKKHLKQLEKETKSLFPLMRGSVVNTGMKDKQPKYSLSMKGKRKFVYLGINREPIARKYVENYQKFEEVVNQMTLINIELIRRVPNTR